MMATGRKPTLGAMLLAAGPSSRLGQPKQLIELGGEPLVRRTARLLLAMEPQFVTVVCGHERERVQAAVQDLPVTTLHNPGWSLGMGGSINSAARAITGNPDGMLIMVCDQWRLDAADMERLTTRWNSDISKIVLASWTEGSAYVSGPPVIFPRKLIPELKSMQESRGARQLIDRYMEIAEFVEIPNAGFDLDRPADLERLKAERS